MACDNKEESFNDERLSFFIVAWVKVLESKNVAFFLEEKPRPLVILSTELSLEDAVDVLKKNNLKSAPVQDTLKKFIGLLDMTSILKYSLSSRKHASLLFGEDFLSSSDLKYPEDMKVAVQSDVAYLARMKRFKTVDVKQTLLELAQNLQRTPAVGITKKGKLISIISQGHFVRKMNNLGWLKEQRVTLGDIMDAKKCALKLDTATDALSTYEVFAEMARLNRSSIGVLQEKSGTFIGSLKLMDITTFYDLEDQEVETNIVEYLQRQKYPALVCEKDTLLVDAMLKICSKRSHRIWVLEDKKPLAICSISDVLALVS